MKKRTPLYTFTGSVEFLLVTPSGILASLVAFAIIDCSAERTRSYGAVQIPEEAYIRKATDFYRSLFYGDSIGNRTRVTAVKGRCLNRLTMEPYSNYAFTI